MANLEVLFLPPSPLVPPAPGPPVHPRGNFYYQTEFPPLSLSCYVLRVLRAARASPPSATSKRLPGGGSYSRWGPGSSPGLVLWPVSALDFLPVSALDFLLGGT
jgi:hypothetical protein